MFRNSILVGAALIVIIGLLPLVVTAQPSTQPSTRPAQMSGGMMDRSSSGIGGQGQPVQMDRMDKMAESMTAMAQMCQTMMQREDRALRYVAIGACVLGILLAAALILFIVLEVQWIRFFGVRTRTEKAKLVRDGSEKG
jgi:hypothetical protein